RVRAVRSRAAFVGRSGAYRGRARGHDSNAPVPRQEEAARDPRTGGAPMSDDILSEATRALREDTLESDESTRSTRNRVMASLHRHERRRRSRIVWLLPIASVLAGT